MDATDFMVQRKLELEKVYASLQMGFMSLCMSARSPAQVRAMGERV
jgi:hypothetical protein